MSFPPSIDREYDSHVTNIGRFRFDSVHATDHKSVKDTGTCSHSLDRVWDTEMQNPPKTQGPNPRNLTLTHSKIELVPKSLEFEKMRS